MIPPAQLLLSYLLFMNLGGTRQGTFTHGSCEALKTGALSRAFNRVCNNSAPSFESIQAIKDYFGTTPFTWVVDSNDVITHNMLQQTGFDLVFTGSGMLLDMHNMQSIEYPAGLRVREVHNDEEIEHFLRLVSLNYHRPLAHVSQAFNYLIAHAPAGLLHAYLAYDYDTPVATALAIDWDTTASIHWISTLETYRQRGIGSAISHYVILHARERGMKYACLCATSAAQTIYERLGFTWYALYNFYALENDHGVQQLQENNSMLNTTSLATIQKILLLNDQQMSPIAQKLHGVSEQHMREFITLLESLCTQKVAPSPLLPYDAVLVDPENHEILAETDYIRVLWSTLSVGQTGNAHTHQWPNITLMLSGSNFSSNKDNYVSSVYEDAGVYYIDPQIVPESFKNHGPHDFKALSIELKQTLP